MRDGQYAEGLRLLRELNRKTPNNPPVQYHLGWGLAKNGQRDEGLALLRQAAASSHPDISQAAQAALQEFGATGN